jgi:NAD(P)-dependent dehydrogenase (short-subunit alcohol dehydrogenase family)
MVTGGATAVGASLVAHFAMQGAKVAFIDIDEAAGLSTAEALSASATPPLFLHADLTDTEQLRAAMQAARDAFGPIAVLMNNAANDARHSIEATTPQSWDAGVAINLKQQFFAAQAVIPDMKQLGGGSIVNFGSIIWMLKYAGVPVYATCKAAVQGLTRSLARELGAFHIRVNSLVPGAVVTDKQLRLWLTPESLEEIKRNQCLPDHLLPSDIARMALFLASDDSAMCTAQDFVVDAGWT